MGYDRRVDWASTVFIILVHVGAVAGTALYASLHGFTWAALAIAGAMFVACGVSVTAGYHRLFAHGSYRAHPLVRAFYLVFGAATFQNSVLQWATAHRRHHRDTDEASDPYSIRQGFWWAHMGWLFFKDPLSTPEAFAADLKADPLIRLQYRFYIPIASLAGFGLPLALGFLAGDPWGGLLIGGLLRLVCLYQATFCVNSVAHTLGTQPYSDRDSSRDSVVTALLSLGEGYHNFHHSFPYDYRNGVRAWHFDPSKWWIRVLSWLGLTRDLVSAPRELVLKARLRMQERKATVRFADRPQVAELLRSAREKLENLLDRWAALKARVAELRARLDRVSLDSLRRELREVKESFREAYRLWRSALRQPELLAVSA